MGKVILLMRKAWAEGPHPRAGNGRFTLAPDTGMNPPGENGGKRPASLKNTIHTILYGTAAEKKALEGKHYHLADTPPFMKDLEPPIKGEYFTVKYGVISHHKNKDADHNLSEQEWLALCDAITKPFAITTREGGHSLFTELKHNNKPVMVGIELKGRMIEVNAIKTAYAAKSTKGEKIIYTSEKITPEQGIFLGRPNSAKKPTGVTSPVSTGSIKKSSGSPGKDPSMIPRKTRKQLLVKYIRGGTT